MFKAELEEHFQELFSTIYKIIRETPRLREGNIDFNTIDFHDIYEEDMLPFDKVAQKDIDKRLMDRLEIWYHKHNLIMYKISEIIEDRTSNPDILTYPISGLKILRDEIFSEFYIDFLKSCKLTEWETDRFVLKHKRLYYISSVVDQYNMLKTDNSDDFETTNNFDTTTEIKICLLNDLGIIDYLKGANMKLNPNQISEIIEFLTKKPIKSGAVNMALSRIHNGGLIDKHKSSVAELKLKFKIKSK